MKYKSSLTEDVTSTVVKTAKMYLKSTDRAAFAKAGQYAGIDGNKAFQSIGAGINEIQNILDTLNLKVDDNITIHYYGSPDGRADFRLYRDDREIQNSMLILSWHKREETGNFEVIAYLS